MKLKKLIFLGLGVVFLVAGCGNQPAPEIRPAPVLPSVTDTPAPTVTPTPLPSCTPTPTVTPTLTPELLDITLCFAGDVSLADDAVTTAQWEKNGRDLSKCISPELLRIMQEADLTCVNNEFTFSERGKPMAGKAYTFRAKPERVSLLQEMGVDLALLANNHVFDYGKESLLDTLATLEGAGIAYFGAGHNLEEAMAPYYIELDGITVAFVAASRAEKNKMTPQATETEPGILRCYDTELFLKTIREADANADYVVACVHWGTEYSTVLEEVQVTTGKQYLDAGADAIIGSHSHCLQGMEFYDGKPVIYSLGNFWFNRKSLDTMLLLLHITGTKDNPQTEVKIVPAIQENYCTIILTEEEEKIDLYDFLEDISINVEIDADGVVKEYP